MTEQSYWNRWGLASDPFDTAADLRFGYLTQAFSDALTMLHFTVQRNRGAASLTGPTGSGKSLVLQCLAQTLQGEGITVVQVAHEKLTGAEILRQLARRLNCAALTDDPNLLRQSVHLEFLHRFDSGQRIVIMVDNADSITDPSALGILHEITEARIGAQYAVNMILAGTPELSRRIVENPRLMGRLAFQIQLGPVQADELRDLLFHRLTCAGWTSHDLPITIEALELLHRTADGNAGTALRLLTEAMSTESCIRAGMVDAFYLYQALQLGETAA